MVVSQRLDLRDITDFSTAENEYWAHVASQDKLPIAAGAAASPLVTEISLLASAVPQKVSPDKLSDLVASHLLMHPSLIHQLRLLVGVSGKRLYLDLSYHFSPLLSGDLSRRTTM
jgi:hypothetical protein